MIPEIVELKFNPETGGDEIQKVFGDDLARLLWLAIKVTHIVSQNFDADCLRCAKILREYKQKSPLTAKQLLHVLGRSISASGSELAFATELLPFVNGEKNIGFKIVS